MEHVFDVPLLQTAWEYRHDASGYDAVYLAAARLHGATLLTADTRLADAPDPGVPVHLVRG